MPPLGFAKNKNKKSQAYLGPKDLALTNRQANDDFPYKYRRSDTEQVPAPELRGQPSLPPIGWPEKNTYLIARMHIDLDYADGKPGIMDSPVPATSGKGKDSPGKTENGPQNKGKFASNKSGRVLRNTYAQRGNTG